MLVDRLEDADDFADVELDAVDLIANHLGPARWS